MRVRLDHIDANPYRAIDRYPLREDKITALRESINTTGFWSNLLGRVVGGRVQIAYGHHRHEALRREFPPEHEIDIIVRELDDEQMIKIMARENMAEWGSSATVEQETVRAVVEAYAVGRIELSPPSSPNARGIRHAPSFRSLRAQEREHVAGRPYTASPVAEFLGWSESKTQKALLALETIESGHLKDDDFRDLGTQAARALVHETNRVLLAQQREAEEDARQATAAEEAREQATKRAAEAEAAQRAALERGKAAKEQAERDQAEREFTEQRKRAATAEQQRARAEIKVDELRRERNRAEKAREVHRQEVTAAVRGVGGKGPAAARQAADAVHKKYKAEAIPVDLGRVVHSLATSFSRYFGESDHGKRLAEVFRYRKHIADADIALLISGLEDMRDDLDKQLAKLRRPVAAPQPAAPPRFTGPVIDGGFVIDGEVIDDNVGAITA